jgi:hypothetical protein
VLKKHKQPVGLIASLKESVEARRAGKAGTKMGFGLFLKSGSIPLASPRHPGQIYDL